MTLKFPKTPDFLGPLAPVGIETQAENLTVRGVIPEEVSGQFVRVQPDPLYPPMLGDDIFFNGDGMVTSFRFRNGKVDVLQRYVETERLLVQRAAGKSVFGKYRNPYTNHQSVSKSRVYSTANTNIVPYQGKLLALKEDNLPYAMDPNTLATLGIENMNGQFSARTFTAHPKVDPATGNFLAFSYRAEGEETKDIAFYEFDSRGDKVNELWFKSPVVPFIHDFCFTENYLIFPVIPIDQDSTRGKTGANILYWNYARDILFGVLPRNGNGSDVRWFTLPNGFPGHVLNTFEDDGKLYCDLSIGNDNVFHWWPDVQGRAPNPEDLHAPLQRVEFDLLKPENKATIVDEFTEASVEFYKIDERHLGRKYRYAFAIGIHMHEWDFAEMGPPHPFFFNVLYKLDMQTKAARTWYPGATDSLQEPIFVPRSQSSNAPEADGYIIVVVNRLASNRSELAVLDTRDIAAGPIATVECPFRLRAGLHGNWVPNTEHQN